MKKHTAQLIWILMFCGAICSADGADFPNFPLPVYPAAINQKTHLDKPAKGAIAATYQVAAAFPARNLTDFFNNEMMNRGFTPYHDPILALKEFSWNSFNSRTGKSAPHRF